MICYFSGTGNSRWIAEELGRLLEEEVVNITGYPGGKSLEGEILGVVFPVYAWGLPEIVEDFLHKLEGRPSFAFGVCTCGGEAGHAMRALAKHLPLDSSYSFLMPNNYVMGSALDSAEEIEKKTGRAKERLPVVAEEIRSRKKVQEVHEGRFPWVKSTLAHAGFNLAARSTKPFHVDEGCISCGQCARDCPAGAIVMNGHRPEYVKERCYMCTSCINRCPVEAIQYGKSTGKRGRYHFKENGAS